MHARRHQIYPLRYHLAMWVDIAITAISVLNDPYTIPPSLLVFIMVVLGNGMRYGMRLFAEALLGCFGAAMLVLNPAWLTQGWIHAKLVLVLLLVGYHHACLIYLKQFAESRCRRGHVFFRWFNELPVIALLLIIFLAVLKPF